MRNSNLWSVDFSRLKCRRGTKGNGKQQFFEDLKYLDLEELSMESIRKIKKGSFMNMIKKEIRNKAFDKLQLRKKSHTKVENIEHNEIISIYSQTKNQ